LEISRKKQKLFLEEDKRFYKNIEKGRSVVHRNGRRKCNFEGFS
jgi:hypothetical protein